MSDQHELDEIANALAAIIPGERPAILIGWVTVAEYTDLDGRRSLIVRSGSAADTDHLTTSWQRRGYLDEALSSGWDEPTFEIHDDDDTGPDDDE